MFYFPIEEGESRGTGIPAIEKNILPIVQSA
jgi:hypothetical protein